MINNRVDYETSLTFKNIYTQLLNFNNDKIKEFFNFINYKEYKEIYKNDFIKLKESIDKLTNMEKSYLQKTLNAKGGLKKSNTDKIIGYAGDYLDYEYIDLYTQANDLENIEKLKIELEILEADFKIKNERIRRIHLEYGEKLFRAEQIFETLGGQEDFKKWYLSIELNKDFVSQSKKRYHLYLTHKNLEEIKRVSEFLNDDKLAYNFFSSLSIKMILQLTKKEVSRKTQSELLIQIFRGNLTKSTEIPKALIENGTVIKKFSYTKAMTLMNKIDRYKGKLSENEYEYLMFNYMKIEEVLSSYIKSNKSKYDQRVIYDMDKIRATRNQVEGN